MEPTLEDAIRVHRMFQASDQLIQEFPPGLQPLLVEFLWSGGDISILAGEMGIHPSIAVATFRVYRELLLEQCPELREVENSGKKVH